MGGWGATATRDGLDAMYSASHGDTFNCPVEICEARYGLEVDYKRLNESDEGAGAHAGGRGVALPIGRAPARLLSAGYSRHVEPVWGSAGGENGGVNDLSVYRGNGETSAASASSAASIVEPGDEIVISTANGGGWGAPALRIRRRAGRWIRDSGSRFASARDGRDQGSGVT